MTPIGRRARRYDLQTLLLYLIGAAGAAYILVERIRIARGLPLWIDETFTAVIASQPDLASFLDQALLDPAPPLYYLVTWLLPLDGNAALRLPSLLFMIAAAALPLLWRIPRMSTAAAAAWAALLFFWKDGISFSADARPYALLFLLSVAQTIAFARLVDAPSLRRACVWTGLAALAILTHYYAALLGLAQGVALLIVLKSRAVRLWPSLLLLAPAFVWFALHLPRLIDYARPDVAWYATADGWGALGLMLWGLGPYWLVLLAIGLAARLLPHRERLPNAAVVAVLAGIAAIAMMAMLAMMRPMVVDRYLTPAVPALLLGLVLLASNRIGWIALVAVQLSTATVGVRRVLEVRAVQSLEAPTEALLAYRPERLVFSLGYQGQRALASSTARQLGAYHFARHGLDVDARLVPSNDGRALVAAAGKDAAIIWYYQREDWAEADAIKRVRRCADERTAGAGTLACAPASTAARAPSY